jgi:hypothetical protein
VSVANAHPPPNVLRIINPVFRTLLKSPLSPIVPGHLVLLKFKGRRSGRDYEIVTGWHEVDGQHLVFSPARWPVNFEGGAPAEVVRGRTRRRGTGTLVRSPEEIAPKLDKAVAQAGDRNIGMKVSASHTITPDDVRAVGRKMIVLDV